MQTQTFVWYCKQHTYIYTMPVLQNCVTVKIWILLSLETRTSRETCRSFKISTCLNVFLNIPWCMLVLSSDQKQNTKKKKITICVQRITIFDTSFYTHENTIKQSYSRTFSIVSSMIRDSCFIIQAYTDNLLIMH